MTQFTVFGNPIAHSLSPQIHQLFAAQFGGQLNYDRRLATVATFPSAVADFFRCGGQGANVTIPFKVAAMDLVTHLTPRAQRAGSVNTLVPLGHGQLVGDTTDGLGLCRDLQRLLAAELATTKVLIIGAGGAARSVIEPLQALGAEVVIANRSRARVEPLIEVFDELKLLDFASLQAPPEALMGGSDWLLINATSASLLGGKLAIHPSWFAGAKLVYDMMYGTQLTPFLKQATTAGAQQVSDGLGMLVEQAAVSYALWHPGQMPDTASVLTALR
ncbi:Shikimate dehydrogenase (NADP(+)) [Pseudidiomarina piscicola]|uniref:Shikimate dehydrogenase (NADP(+)) n=1 Tax=Pseudidiomarina piscicola TaxID=2614830 RepID=A0A6S6WUH9_9GAMM|nr:shikimate dehydrogenase [Pseudidiomarina piscicola]CAB0150817.1 Shikimate dehydrogenase (NADP(+)) [Pseudidiomarina piscicola]VZT40322.1 Shikimate dehydrogenase (NADP(+)) [Pseudomonas aeruginosa]